MSANCNASKYSRSYMHTYYSLRWCYREGLQTVSTICLEIVKKKKREDKFHETNLVTDRCDRSCTESRIRVHFRKRKLSLCVSTPPPPPHRSSITVSLEEIPLIYFSAPVVANCIATMFAVTVLSYKMPINMHYLQNF